jgi:hypothetical protein
MNIIEIFDASPEYSRNLFLLIDQLPHFCLVECRLKQDVEIPGDAGIVFLDHIDMSVDPNQIINRALALDSLDTLVLVSKRKSRSTLLPTDCILCESYTFSAIDDCTVLRSVCDNEHYKSLEDAACEIFRLTKKRRAA